MAAYMEFDLNDSQSSYSPSSSSPSIGRLSVWSDQEDDKSKPCGKFCDHQFGEANEDQGRQVEENQEDSDRGSYKWMPSKMRILRKMMSSNRMDQGSDSGPKFEDQKRSPLEDVDHNQSNTTHKSSFKSLMNEAIRVCSDCNTTKTPLWRSGPRGPKSLCNACGIRQRKARRAMAAAAAAAANGTVLPIATAPLKIKLKHKNKRPKIDLHNDTDQSNKRRQVAASPSSDGVEEKLIRFEEFTTRILSGFEKVFPQDEKEAAILLMALSYGLVCSS